MEEVKNWWRQAKRDLKTAKDNIDTKNYYASSFYSQQAVEKALKALYIRKFKKLLKVHDIVFLAEKLKLPDNLIEACDKLNPVYVESRYPDVSGILPIYSYKKEDAIEDLKIAKKVLKWIKEKL